MGDALSGRTIFRFYSPLALSWVFMGLDGPISVAVMSGLPAAKVNTAAFLILISLAIWIESPVIDLLSTSTTLGKGRDSLATIDRFVLWLIGWVTVAHGLVTLTPLYGVVTGTLLHVEPAVAEAARPGLVLMLPWSGFIGWRRSRQGLLIRNGRTRVIGLGTILRVAVLLLVDVLLSHQTHLTGLTVAASGLIASVAAEAIFIHFVSRSVILEINAVTDDAPLSMRRLWAFHAPLTATTMVKLLIVPVVTAGIARLADPTRSLAAYEVAGTVIFLFRAIAFCLPEVVIALYRDEESRRALQRFALTVGICASGFLFALSLLRVDVFLFQKVLGTEADLAERAHWMFLASSLAPLLDASMSYVLGVLTAHHLTMARMVAVAFSSLALLVAVAVAVTNQWSAPVLVGMSVAVSLIAELIVLVAAWTKAKPRLADVLAQ